MPKPIKHPRRQTDVNRLARHFVGISTREYEDVQAPTKAQISLLMAQLGKKGGKIGGKRRLETLSPERRREIARKAAQVRWGGK